MSFSVSRKQLQERFLIALQVVWIRGLGGDRTLAGVVPDLGSVLGLRWLIEPSRVLMILVLEFGGSVGLTHSV